jgi:hypothetical protein
VLRKLAIGVAVMATLVAGVGTARLVLPWTDPARGVVKQLAFLRAELEGGAETAAQKQFPEGYFFLNVLYGLSWVQVGIDEPERSADATAEVRWALDRIASPAGTAPFNESLQPRYGVFYAGWTNWLRGGLIALGHSDAADRDTFTSDSVEIATAFRTAQSPFLAAYPGQAWPVDSVVAIASLRLYDALVAPRFGQTARNWVTTAKTRLDPATGLFPHQVVPQVPAHVARRRPSSSGSWSTSIRPSRGRSTRSSRTSSSPASAFASTRKESAAKAMSTPGRSFSESVFPQPLSRWARLGCTTIHSLTAWPARASWRACRSAVRRRSGTCSAQCRSATPSSPGRRPPAHWSSPTSQNSTASPVGGDFPGWSCSGCRR